MKREYRMLRGYDPTREMEHGLLICTGIIYGLVITAELYNATQQSGPEAVASNYLSLGLGLFLQFGISAVLLFGWVSSYRGFRTRRARMLQLRKMALMGNAPLCSLSSQAPLPLSLPYTVRMRISKKFLATHGISLFICIAFIVGIFLSISRYYDLIEQLGFVASVLPTLLLIPVKFITTLVEARWETPKLTLNDEGITAHYWCDRVIVRWEEVCFFAITGQGTPGSAWIFELSDGQNTIRWADVSSVVVVKPYIPVMEPAQYAALIQALPRWICARTGLPLYDLYSRK